MKKFKTEIMCFLVMLSLLLVPPCEAKKRHKKRHCSTVRSATHRYEPLLTGVIGLQRISDEMNRHATAGVAVQSLRTGEILYQKEANQFFSPASNMKVITAFVALKFLGPQFTYYTRLMTEPSASIHQGVLEGNLYVQYTGDPTLQLEDLNTLFSELRSQGINSIRGRLYVDTSLYADEGASPGTEKPDQSYCYGAPVTAAIINRNCVSFTLNSSKPGQLAQLSFPYNVPLPINNQLVTSAKRYCHYSLKTLSSGDYLLEGCIRPHKSAAMTVVVPANGHYGESAAAALLVRNGINVMEQTIPTSSGVPMKVLAAWHSAPLSTMVVDMMKRSDNVIASTLFKTVGALYNKVPATWENSAAAEKLILKQNHIDVNGIQIIDGSGLSRENRVSPMQFLEILRAAYNDPHIAPLYLEAMPVGGLNGTLRNRLGAKDIIGKVKAKTGTMHGISSLSGYVEANSGEVLAFSIIVNDFNGGVYFYHELQDKLCRVMRVSY